MSQEDTFGITGRSLDPCSTGLPSRESEALTDV